LAAAVNDFNPDKASKADLLPAIDFSKSLPSSTFLE